MDAYLFPGQGTQFPGMGKELFATSEIAKKYFNRANDILGFPITDIMFKESSDGLKQTKYAQPAIFLYSFILTKTLGSDFKPDMIAGHSLGELSALAVADCLDFDSALRLIAKRANAMQKACDVKNTGMAVVVGLYDVIVENVCKQVDGVVVPANYNTLHQVVISGEIDALNEACQKLGPGASRVVQLPVNGAFHSPFMESIVEEYRNAVEETGFREPRCPIYQNVTGRFTYDTSVIKRNLIDQLTYPVMWRHTILHMIEDGATEFIEIGPGNFLSGLVRQINNEVKTQGVF